MQFASDEVASRYAFDDADMAIYTQGQTAARRHSETNVTDIERIASGIVGGVLAVSGLSLVARGRVLSGSALGAAGAMLALRSVTGHCPVYERAGVRDADRDTASAPWTQTLALNRSIAIHRPAMDVYAYWRDLQNLPHIIPHLERVDVLDERRSRWFARGPANTPLTWDATIISDQAGESIAWTSPEDSELTMSGSVQFTAVPGVSADTLVRISMEYQPPAGALGGLVAKVFGRDPQRELEKGLRRFKAIMEAGEAIGTHGQPRGACE